jgi:ABC-type bacteriocin/lantibiotic exporter with double-glycine peptidase domain
MLSKLIFLLTPPERKRAGVLMLMILVMTILDTLGVASILPFIALLSNPNLVENNPILTTVFHASSIFGVSTMQQFLFTIGIVIFVLLVFSLSFKALTTYAQTHFAYMCEYSIGKRMLEGYLHQPYSWYLNRHSTDLGKNILSEVNTVIGNGLLPLMVLITQSAMTLALLILLIIVAPKIAVLAGVVLGVVYSTIYLLMRGWLKQLGQVRNQANDDRFTAVSEAFGAVKEVKAGGHEQAYLSRFATPAKVYAKGQANVSVIGLLPRFALEAIAFGGMLLIMLYQIKQSGGLAAALPIVTLFAITGYRVMPALQQIYVALTQLRFVGPALEDLHADLVSLKAARAAKELQPNRSPMQVTQVIELNQVVYRYPNALRPAIRGINMTIPAHSSVGLVGATGSGKSTTVDVILGLLEPQNGTLTIDGQVINEANRREWQCSIGYVPQQIYLADDTVSANIAFGVSAQDVDQHAVERAAKIARLHDFVTVELPRGYATPVGERGVRLSGGQRQRIGLARALYNCPGVLILDEATSALDNLTERAVIEAVMSIRKNITIVLIAHRLNTVRYCDKIYLFDNGEVKAGGTYDELMRTNYEFMTMVSGRSH